MNVLIVSAHPEPASLTHALRDVAADQLRGQAHQVRVIDLYEDQWKAAVDRSDFPALKREARLQVPAASGAAFAD